MVKFMLDNEIVISCVILTAYIFFSIFWTYNRIKGIREWYAPYGYTTEGLKVVKRKLVRRYGALYLISLALIIGHCQFIEIGIIAYGGLVLSMAICGLFGEITGLKCLDRANEYKADISIHQLGKLKEDPSYHNCI